MGPILTGKDGSMISVRPVTPNEMIALWPWTPEEQEILLDFGRRSPTLVGGWWDGQLMGFLGITDLGYIWGQPTPEAGLHPRALALRIRRFVLEAHKRYPILFGNCSQGNWRWNQICLGAYNPRPEWPFVRFSVKGLP